MYSKLISESATTNHRHGLGFPVQKGMLIFPPKARCKLNTANIAFIGYIRCVNMEGCESKKQSMSCHTIATY